MTAQVWALGGVVSFLALAGLALPVVANDGLSLVLPALQSDCVFRPVPSAAMHLRHGLAGGIFLYGLRELEHLSHFELDCTDCPSKVVTLGAEYHFVTALWKWRNRASSR
jgi:hypothetical protein